MHHQGPDVSKHGRGGVVMTFAFAVTISLTIMFVILSAIIVELQTEE